MPKKPTMVELVAAVRKHALAHYEKSGWDYVVEAYEDSEIEEVLRAKGATSVKKAIAAMKAEVGPRDDYRRDIQAEAGPGYYDNEPVEEYRNEDYEEPNIFRMAMEDAEPVKEEPVEPSGPPWWADLTLAERERHYTEDMESWGERYAEAGSSWVFGGGASQDALWAADEGAGPEPRRENYGLPPVEPSTPSWMPHRSPEDDDIPF